MLVDRNSQNIADHHFYEIENLLGPNDVLILNQSKVFPARIFGKKSTGGQVELLLYRQVNSDTWESISRPGLKPGTTLFFDHNLSGEVTERNLKTGQIKVRFNQGGADFFNSLDLIGKTPIPPYINSPDSEKKLREKYQTVYAKETGSAAAPTAGLHFTKDLLEKLAKKGVEIEYVTLHVGLGTFKPLEQENIDTGKLHLEYYEVTKETAEHLNHAKTNGKRIIAVGTTSLRTLESAAVIEDNKPKIIDGKNSTELFIHPPYKFKFVDALITNFHLPESSLLMLVTAFSSAPNSINSYTNFLDSAIGQAYRFAIDSKYRFFSFGDAMFIY
jgi:S-adenosylmethionine:tRNA ribosyltransferase-isomerase